MSRVSRHSLGAAVTIDELELDPHPILAQLRREQPVAWVPALGGWLVTRHDLVLQAMRDSETFTVDDPRFSTAQVVGPSMLSLDGDAHARHRAPFVGPFRAAEVAQRFQAAAAERAEALVQRMAPEGTAELRTELAGPMAAAMMATALGLHDDEVGDLLAWYQEIVASVTSITAGTGPTDAGTAAYEELAARLRARGERSPLLSAAAAAHALSAEEIASNAAVLLFGGIETTEGMIASAALHLLQHPDAAASQPLDAVIDESLRLEPAAAVIDRYSTTDTVLGDTAISRGDLVRLSLTAANRDPEVFTHPDRFDPSRPNLRRHLAFAQGPHVCVGVHLARLETRAALGALTTGLPQLALDPNRPAQVRGLVFRKPPALHVRWAPA